MGCGPVAKPPVLGTGNRRFESGHPDQPWLDKHTFVDGRGERIELSEAELRYLVATTKQLNGTLWDKASDRIAVENLLYKLGLIQFRVEQAEPTGMRCILYPTAIAAVQLIARGLI